MIIKTGVDITSIERIKTTFKDKKKWSRIFTKEEIAYFNTFNDPFPTIAGRFAAKEAFYKAVSFLDVNFEFNEIGFITNREKGLKIIIYNEKLKRELKDWNIEMSITHDSGVAVAFCITYENN